MIPTRCCVENRWPAGVSSVPSTFSGTLITLQFTKSVFMPDFNILAYELLKSAYYLDHGNTGLYYNSYYQVTYSDTRLPSYKNLSETTLFNQFHKSCVEFNI